MSLTADLRVALGPGIGVAVRRVGDAPPPWPAEAGAVARAVPARQMEFAAGRACIRDALADLGVPAAAVPMGADRAPVWPEGVTGSLAHGAGLCVAIVAPTARCAGLGVDIEPDLPLPPEAAAEVLSPREAALPGRDHRVIFCAKEAVYKAHYPATRTVWGFDAVTVALDDGGFTACLAALPGAAPVRGHILRRDSVIVTAVVLSARK